MEHKPSKLEKALIKICEAIVMFIYPAIYYIILKTTENEALQEFHQETSDPQKKSGIRNKRSGATPPAKQ